MSRVKQIAATAVGVEFAVRVGRNINYQDKRKWEWLMVICQCLSIVNSCPEETSAGRQDPAAISFR